MKHSFYTRFKNVMLRPIEEKDLELLREWRNDPEISTEFLTKLDYITPEKQLEWFKRDLENTNCYTFAICECDQLNEIIGSVALYNFSGKQVEFGRFLIGHQEARGKGLGVKVVCLCLFMGFTMLGANEIVAVVHEDNIAAVTVYTRAGFDIVGKRLLPDGSGHELEIMVKKNDFFGKHDFLSEIRIK